MSDEQTPPADEAAPAELNENGHTVGSLEDRLALAKGVTVDVQTGSDGTLLFKIVDKLFTITAEDRAGTDDVFPIIQRKYQYQLAK